MVGSVGSDALFDCDDGCFSVAVLRAQPGQMNAETKARYEASRKG